MNLRTGQIVDLDAPPDEDRYSRAAHNGLSVARPRAGLGTDGFLDFVLRRDLDDLSVPVRPYRRAVDVDRLVLPRAGDDLEARDVAGHFKAEGIAAAHNEQAFDLALVPLVRGNREAGAVPQTGSRSSCW